jgi:hypothetical protein
LAVLWQQREGQPGSRAVQRFWATIPREAILRLMPVLVNEADEPNAIINFFGAERLPRKDG